MRIRPSPRRRSNIFAWLCAACCWYLSFGSVMYVVPEQQWQQAMFCVVMFIGILVFGGLALYHRRREAERQQQSASRKPPLQSAWIAMGLMLALVAWIFCASIVWG